MACNRTGNRNMVCSAKRRCGYRLARLQSIADLARRLAFRRNVRPTASPRTALDAGVPVGQEFCGVDLIGEDFLLGGHEGVQWIPSSRFVSLRAFSVHLG